MSSNQTPTRKQRRAAERAARKSGTSGASGAGPERLRGSRGGGGPSMLIISLAAIGIGLVAVVALVLVSGGFGGNDATAISEPGAPAPKEELRQGRTLVAPGASPAVTVEVFEDAQCPHCGTFTRQVEPLIIAEHVETGTASFEYKDYIVFGEPSVDAAVAMRAADELGDAFWDFQHYVYYNQADGEFTSEWFADIAEAIGLDREAFLGLLADEGLRADVSADIAQAQTHGISSTPSVVIDGVLLGSSTWDDIDAAIEEAAAAAG